MNKDQELWGSLSNLINFCENEGRLIDVVKSSSHAFSGTESQHNYAMVWELPNNFIININAYHTNLTIRNSSLRAMIWIRRKYVNWLPFSKTITCIELLEGSDCQYEIYNLYDWCHRHFKAKDLVSNAKEKRAIADEINEVVRRIS